MVNMGMGGQHIVHIRIADGKLGVFKLIHALLHAAVHQDIEPACLQKVAAPGYFMIRSDKCKFHSIISCSFPARSHVASM